MSTSSLVFSKYQGLGNDFLIVDLREQRPCPSPDDHSESGYAIARALCDRRLGVGGDGVLSLGPARSKGATASMRVLNADGSEAEMCGNGLRCVAKYLLEREAQDRPDLIIDTGAGALSCRATWNDGAVDSVTVDMGPAHLQRRDIPMSGPPNERCLSVDYEIAGRSLSLSAVSMGNPHAITFVSESGPALRQLAQTLGPVLEQHPDFPNRCNAEFAHMRSRSEIELWVWERGCGITQACGTGACATAVAACLAGLAEPGTELEVSLPGGILHITVAPDYSQILMRGPAVQVFEGTVDLASLVPGADQGAEAG